MKENPLNDNIFIREARINSTPCRNIYVRLFCWFIFYPFLTKYFSGNSLDKNRWKASIISTMFPGAVGKIRSEIPLFVCEPGLA